MHNLTRGHPRVIKKKNLTEGLSPCDCKECITSQGDWRAGSTLALSREGDAPNLTGGLSPCDSGTAV